MKSILNNNRGSILILTIGAIFVFTLLGISSVYVSSLQNQIAEKQRAQAQALWLADAGVEKAKHYLRKSPPVLLANNSAPAVSTDGTFGVTSVKDPGCATCVDRWQVHAEGTVNTGKYTGSGTLANKRAIEAIIAKYDIDNAISAEGTVNSDCTPNGSAEIIGPCEQLTP